MPQPLGAVGDLPKRETIWSPYHGDKRPRRAAVATARDAAPNFARADVRAAGCHGGNVWCARLTCHIAASSARSPGLPRATAVQHRRAVRPAPPPRAPPTKWFKNVTMIPMYLLVEISGAAARSTPLDRPANLCSQVALPWPPAHGVLSAPRALQ